MEVLVIKGGQPLRGSVSVCGGKNAVLPMMAASLMIKGKTVLHNVPSLSDVDSMARILTYFGVKIKRENEDMELDATSLCFKSVPEEKMKAIRASNLLWGPLLDRFGKAELPYPGGCRIGLRPMDLHFKGLALLGVETEDQGGLISSRGYKRKGTTIYLDYPSVGATENILMAAVRARGSTILKNAAREPEVAELCFFLNQCGASIHGIGGDSLFIEGVRELHESEYTVLPDRIVGGTLLLSALISSGDIVLNNIGGDQLSSVASKLTETGAEVSVDEHSLRLRSNGRYCGVDLRTMPYPGFPTDLQPPFTAAMTKARGVSVIKEEIFEHRLGFCSELKKLGAKISVDGSFAVVKGRADLIGAEVEATDLRGGAALILAGLAAEGCTLMKGVSYVDRGYPSVEKCLLSLGADIKRIRQ